MTRLFSLSAVLMTVLAHPALAQAVQARPRPPVQRVPEIDLYSGVGAAMAVATLGLLLWDRRRRSVRS